MASGGLLGTYPTLPYNFPGILSSSLYCSSWALRLFSLSISVPNQAFLDVSSAQNPAITYGTSGIMGLGFTSLSGIDAVVSKTGSSSGRSLLYNLFNDNLKEPNFIAFSLQRSMDPASDVQGTFLIGELDPNYAEVNQTLPIPTFPVSSPTRWNILIEAILLGNGDVIPMSSTVPNAPSNRAVALLDSGTSYRCACILPQLESWFRASHSYAPPEVCEAIYQNVTGALQDPQTGLWSIPCDAEIDVAVQIK